MDGHSTWLTSVAPTEWLCRRRVRSRDPDRHLAKWTERQLVGHLLDGHLVCRVRRSLGHQPRNELGFVRRLLRLQGLKDY